MLKDISIALCLILTGCLLPAESALRVRGAIQDGSGQAFEQCNLTVHMESLDRTVDHRKVASVFSETVIVSPDLQSYLFSITCAGSQDRFVSDDLELGSVERYRQEVDLGTIRLRRQKAEGGE